MSLLRNFVLINRPRKNFVKSEEKSGGIGRSRLSVLRPFFLSMLSALTLFALSRAQRSCIHSSPPFAGKQSEIIIFEGLLRHFKTQFEWRIGGTLHLFFIVFYHFHKKKS